MTRLIVVTVFLAFAGSALAQNLPRYYPTDELQRSGVVNAVHTDERRIVINDLSYEYSDTVVVHSMSSFRASFSRVRSGVKIAYKMGGGQQIVEIWLLPPNHSDLPRARR